MQRRRFLTLSTAAVAGSVAGCTDAIPGSDSTEATAPDANDVLDLMHAPGTFEDSEHYSFSASSPAEVDALRGDIDEEVFTQLTSGARRGQSGRDLIEIAGVNFWDVGTQYTAGPVTAIIGDFSREDVWRRIRYEGLQYQGDYDGYALMEFDTGDGVTIAIEGAGRSDAEEAPTDISLVLLTVESGDSSSNAVMRDAIDVVEGEGDRYRDTVEPVVSLVEGLSGSAFVTGETFDVVSPEDGPSGSLDHEPIPLDQSVSGTLTSDSTATLGGREYYYMDRYGFVGGAETEVVISAVSTGQANLGIVLFNGNGSSTQIAQDDGTELAEVSARLSEDGPYNFVVFDPDQINRSNGNELAYTVEVSLSGGSFGGPENGVFEGEVARGNALRFETENMVHRWVLVFEEQPSMDEVETWVTENSDEDDVFGQYESVTQEANGNRAVIEGTIPLADVEPENLAFSGL